MKALVFVSALALFSGAALADDMMTKGKDDHMQGGAMQSQAMQSGSMQGGAMSGGAMQGQHHMKHHASKMKGGAMNGGAMNGQGSMKHDDKMDDNKMGAPAH